MSKSRKVQLEKKIMIFLSSGVFIFSGLYASNVQAAPVFSSGSASDSTVAGVNNTASANSSSAFGYFNTAGGLASSAFGWSNTASAENASAFGYVNEASGLASSAVGFRNKAASENASAIGYGNNANALAASAVGYNNTAGGVGSSTIGYNNTATNENASAFGYGNTAGGLASSAFGFSNTASGDNANAFGYNNIASGSKSNVFGTGNTVSGSSSTAVGTANEVAAENSTAIGNNNTISSGAENSAALGNNISISLKDSVALGNNSTATAINSVTGNSSYTKWAGVSDVVGVVSVGSSGATRQIQNVAAGQVSATSTDAVNGSQLHDVKTLAGQHTTVKAKDSNITVTEGTNGTGGKEYTVGLGDKVTLGTDPSKQVSIDGTTGIIKAGDKVTIDGTTGNIDAGKVKINGKDGTVNGLTNKTWDPNNITSGQAATEDQLKAVDQKITNTSEELTKKGMDFAGNDGEFHRNLGDKVTIKGEGTKAASEYSGENIKTFADANGNLTVKMDKNLKTETIVATGKNGKDGKIGINGKDGVTTNISVTRDGKPGVDGAPGTTTTRIVYEKPDGTKEEVATLNDGMKYGGDTGNVIKKKLNEQVNVVGGITDENKLTTEDNLGVVSDGNNNLKVRMAKDLKGLNSVTTNTLTVGNVKIDNSGINAGNKKITNVAAGDISANSTDAVNGGQLWKTNQTINNIGGAVNELGDRMDRVGAGAAALAALHPLDFDPDDKWDVAAGYGNYKDAHAVAVGAFYRPNEDTMFSVGGSFGGGENMVNAGVSVKLGQGNHVSTSKVAMAKEIKDLRAELENVKGALLKVADGRPLDSMDMDKMQLFPDVPENHWAYDYVATLAGNGVIVGYPDGQFGGDRMMTRYEMAALIYRAMQNGAAADDRMARALKEFEPELERIRVDTISKHKDGTPDIQRVRVIKGRG